MRKLILGLFLALTLALPVQGWAVTKIISDNTSGTYLGDWPGTDDTKLQEPDPTTNYDTDSQYEVSKYAAASHSHVLIRFPGLINITGPVTVSSVTFGLYLDDSSASTYSVDFRRVLRTWTTTQATWDVYTTGNNWTTGGAESAGNDRTGTASGTLSIDSSVGWKAITQTTTGGMIDDVQGWINGTVTNNGWHLERADAGEDSNYKLFSASESTNEFRPYLSVTYTVDGGSPVTSFFPRRLQVNP